MSKSKYAKREIRGRVRDIVFDGYGRLWNLEAAYVRRMVGVGFTLDDVKRWLWPDEVIKALEHAYLYADSPLKGFNFCEFVHPAEFCERGVLVTIPGKQAQMLVPDANLLRYDPAAAPAVTQAVHEVIAAVEMFDTVRKVLDWANCECTPNALKHYAPSLGPILPEDCAFHTVEGKSYRVPVITAEELQWIREAPEIICKGMLAGQAPSLLGNPPAFSVCVNTLHGKSQRFRLL